MQNLRPPWHRSNSLRQTEFLRHRVANPSALSHTHTPRNAFLRRAGEGVSAPIQREPSPALSGIFVRGVERSGPQGVGVGKCHAGWRDEAPHRVMLGRKDTLSNLPCLPYRTLCEWSTSHPVGPISQGFPLRVWNIGNVVAEKS